MSTELVLDFGKIRELEEPLPDIGVADFIPFKGDGRDNVLPVKGIVLELNNRQALKRGIEVPAGPGMLYVRLPTGEMLAERVEVEPTKGQTTGMLVLKVPRAEQRLVYRDVVHAFSAARPYQGNRLLRAPSESADRSRWSTVKFESTKREGVRALPQKLSSFLEPFASRVVSEQQGNRGIAKLQSSAGNFILAPKLGGGYFDSALVGQVQAVKPAKLYGSRDELRAQWKAPVSAGRIYGAEKDDRYFALSFVEAADKPMPLQVACLPATWRTLTDDSAQLTVQYARSRTATKHRGFRVVVGVDDPRVSALLQFMQTGDLASSVSLLPQAEHALYEKFMNPYAAAAGGYVLTHAGYRMWSHDWGRWLYNLATHFPALPDGHILLANLILQGPESCKGQVPGYARDQAWTLALRSVLESVKRGPPMYRFGLRMLSSSIAILKHLVDADHVDRPRLNDAADYVRNLSMRVDPYQPFCVFDVGRNAL